jgi:hypothetical protein
VHPVVVSPSFIGGLVATLTTILFSFLSCAILAGWDGESSLTQAEQEYLQRVQQTGAGLALGSVQQVLGRTELALGKLAAGALERSRTVLDIGGRLSYARRAESDHRALTDEVLTMVKGG